MSLLLTIFLLLLSPVLSYPQLADPVPAEAAASDRLLEEAEQAADDEYYDKALSLLKEGMDSYPDDKRFPGLLGDIYEDQELYNLALDAYKRCESLDADDQETKEKLASVLGYLDRNYEALAYLEELVDSGEERLLDDLGWMYYKTHKPEEGIVRIERALEKGFDRNLSLTLGTLYSEINDAALCRKYYLAAIEDALDEDDSYFASVGYYNLSLAEKSFYDYAAAEDYAIRSLDLMDRSSGHLSLGDLYLQKLDFEAAEREFGEAVKLDKTPLARTNLLTLYQFRGRQNAALEELSHIASSSDESWMYYYGLNKDQFDLDLYSQYRDAYEGLYHQTLLFKDWESPLGRLGDLLKYKLKALQFGMRHRLLALKEGRMQLDGGSLLRGNLTVASGTEGYEALSSAYYQRALELEGFPQAGPWYDLALGRERKDEDLLYKALEGFDREWERKPREEALRELVFLSGPLECRRRDDLIREIFESNPGGLLQYGFRLPVSLEVSGGNAAFERRFRRVLKGSGFRLRNESPLVLRIRRGDDDLACSLNDADGRVLISERYPLEDVGFSSLVSWARRFRRAVFFP